MPIRVLCPKTSLWKFGKHSKRGRRSKSIKASPSARGRKVNTKGADVHPIQVQLGPLTMSPGSFGGVYMGPPKKDEEEIKQEPEAVVASSVSQDKKLAQIRLPTEYYTDGTSLIGQDDIQIVATPVVEEETNPSGSEKQPQQQDQERHLQQQQAAVESRYNDTLNPDGNNASIVFFEETFMSRFSHLSTSSPMAGGRNTFPRTPKSANTRKGLANSPLLSPTRLRQNAFRELSQTKRGGHDTQHIPLLSPASGIKAQQNENKFVTLSPIPEQSQNIFSAAAGQCSVTKPQVPDDTKQQVVAMPRKLSQSDLSQSPSKKRRGDNMSENDNDQQACKESAALLTPSKESTSRVKGGNRSRKNVIPSWVRQRRYLPTIDDVDFDQIDLISIHSLTPNNSHNSLALLAADQDTDIQINYGDLLSLVSDDKLKSHELDVSLNNNNNGSTPNRMSTVQTTQAEVHATQAEVHATQVKASATQHKENAAKKEIRRVVLGDLTNTPSPGKGRMQSHISREKGNSKSRPNRTKDRIISGSLSISGKSPKLSQSPSQRRTRRVRSSVSWKLKSSSRENLVNALDQVQQQHNYVNLEFDTGSLVDSSPKDPESDDDGVHDYIHIWPQSPASLSKNARSPLHHASNVPDVVQEVPSIKEALFKNIHQPESKLLVRPRVQPQARCRFPKGRGRFEQVFKSHDLSALPEDPEMENKVILEDEIPRTETRSKPASSLRRSMPADMASLSVRQASPVRRNLFSAPKSKGNDEAEEEDPKEGLITMSRIMSYETSINLTKDQDGRSDKSAYTSLSENDSLLHVDIGRQGHQVGVSGNAEVSLERRQLIEKPSYQDNAPRKARIVRTNSAEESRDINEQRSEMRTQMKRQYGRENQHHDGQLTGWQGMHHPRFKNHTGAPGKENLIDSETNKRFKSLEKKNKKAGKECTQHSVVRNTDPKILTAEKFHIGRGLENGRQDSKKNGQQSNLETGKQRSKEETRSMMNTISQDKTSRGEQKARGFTPRKNTHVETRRSLPAPASAKKYPGQMTPQRHSTTNVRIVQSKLARKQNRKIRRTVEGEEIVEAMTVPLTGKDEAMPSEAGSNSSKLDQQSNPIALPVNGGQASRIKGHSANMHSIKTEEHTIRPTTFTSKTSCPLINKIGQSVIPQNHSPNLKGKSAVPKGHLYEIHHDHGRVVLADSPGDDDAVLVQKIVDDWSQTSKRIVSAHRTTHYVGTHVHAVPDPSVGGRTHARNPNNRKSTTANRAGVEWMANYRPDCRPGKENMEECRQLQPPGTTRPSVEIGAEVVEVGHSAIRRIPMVSSSANVTRRPTSPVIEIYVAAQSYSPTEVDEIDVQEGEILVVNLSMQRETDWMWVYAPRSDRFGYFPAFAARPLEFQQSPSV